MKKNILVITLLLSSVFINISCSRKVTRIDPAQPVDISGRWNNTDSRLVAEEIIQQVINDKWVSNHSEKHNGQKPVVIVGFVSNKSHEHIEAETFIKDVEQSFIQSGRVRLVQGGKKREEIRAERAEQQNNASVSTMKKFGLEHGADYILQGSINSIVDSEKRNKVMYYQVNLELTDLQSNEVVWNGDKKIAKLVRN